MKTIISLLFVTLFVVWVSTFSESQNWHSNLSASRQLETATSSAPAVEEKIALEKVQKAVQEEVQEKKPPAPKPEAQKPPPEPLPAKPTPTPIAQPAAQISFAAEVEAEVLRLTNIERAKAGLGVLAENTQLSAIARGHSKDMLTNVYFSHDNLQGCSSSCRATDAGYRWSTIGENIYMMSGWDLTAEKAAIMIVNGWMGSPGHRENILKAVYTEGGTGIAFEDDTIYATALYAKPR